MDFNSIFLKMPYLCQMSRMLPVDLIFDISEEQLPLRSLDVL